MGSRYFPKAFYDDVADDKDAEKDSNIYIQNILNIKDYADRIPGDVRRKRGGHINGHNSGAEYWFAIYKNDKNDARLFYRSYFNRTIISHIR